MMVDPEVAEVNALVDEFGVCVDELYEGPTEENVNAVTGYAFLDAASSPRLTRSRWRRKRS